MNDYGKSTTLGTFTGLPLTYAGLIATNQVDPLILSGLIGIGLVSIVSLSGYLSRYLINHKKKL